MTPQELLDAATPAQRLILEAIRHNPHESNEVIGNRLGLSRRTIEAQLVLYYKRVPALAELNPHFRRQILADWLRGYNQEN